ncbi:MAG TPA: hypothetical protein PKA83_17980 [Pirellulaceae bacterium]|nr:hypothetical protein [Pirellulaceae bacterium]
MLAVLSHHIGVALELTLILPKTSKTYLIYVQKPMLNAMNVLPI